MDNDELSLQDLTGLIRRRASLVGLTFLGIVMSSIILAYSLESLYKSSGTIIIDRGEVSDIYLRGIYRDANPEQRIERIYDEVMTPQNLAQIIDRHDLYSGARGDGPPESVTSEFRNDFEMQFRLSGDDPREKGSGDVTGLILSYYHPSRETARDVARDVVELFQRENRQRRQAAYLGTAAALERESDELRAQVSNLEGLLAIFKSEHPGALPEDRNFNRQTIERKARDLDGLDREIRSLQDRKTLLQSQLAQTELWVNAIGPSGETLPTTSDQLKTLHAEYLRLMGIYNPAHPDVLRMEREIYSLTGGKATPAYWQAVENELELARFELADARRNYASDHPDLRKLERTVAVLEQKIVDMPLDHIELPAPNNPTYLSLGLQIQAANNELRALRTNRTLLRRESEKLDLKLQVAPEVERRYLELTRDLDLARQQYNESKSRLMSVRRAGVLEEEELAERYVVTHYPSLPYKPAFPNRPLFIVIGLFIGLAIGIGVGMIAEALDNSVRSTRDIKIILDMPPIAAIPQIHTEKDMHKIRASRFVYFSTTGFAVTATAIYVYLQRSGAV